MSAHATAVRHAFARLAREANHTFDEHGDVVELGYGQLRVGLDVAHVDERPGRAAVQITATAESPKLTPAWRDDFVGIGPNVDAAIEQAVGAWVAGPLDLLREALSEPAAEHRYAFTQATAGGERTWLVFEGPLQLSGPGEAQQWLVGAIEELPLFARVAERETMPELAPDRVHVLKLYAAKLGDEPALTEALLDGAPVPAMAEVLAQLPWPPSKAHRMLRQYLCFVPKST